MKKKPGIVYIVGKKFHVYSKLSNAGSGSGWFKFQSWQKVTLALGGSKQLVRH